MFYSGKEIYNIIPNRYPLMILDELTVDEKSATSKIILREDSWFFECHYPGRPIMPFCLLIESMTQTFVAIVCYNYQKMMQSQNNNTNNNDANNENIQYNTIQYNTIQ